MELWQFLMHVIQKTLASLPQANASDPHQSTTETEKQPSVRTCKRLAQTKCFLTYQALRGQWMNENQVRILTNPSTYIKKRKHQPRLGAFANQANRSFFYELG